MIVNLHPMQPSLKCRSTPHEQFWTTCITTTPKPALQARRRRTLGVGQIFCNAKLELESIDANSSSKSIFCGGDASLSATEAAAGWDCKQQLRSTTREKPRVIVIAGPTSVGKTQLSIELAKELNGEVINADSVQVYRGLDIGAAKATMEERQGIPHHLLDMVPATVEYTYEEFMRDSRAATEQILARGRVPIVVGGTGMYMRYYMHAKPGITSKPFEDEAKIIGALAGAGSILVPDCWDYDFQCYFLHKNRAALFRRLDLRCEQQIMTLLEETSRLLDAGLVADSNSAARATGYEEAIPFLMEARAARGFVTEERLLSMLSLFQHNCRNIARQQIKWYRSKDRSEVLSSILVMLNPLPISKSSSQHRIFYLLACLLAAARDLRNCRAARDRNSVARRAPKFHTPREQGGKKKKSSGQFRVGIFSTDVWHSSELGNSVLECSGLANPASDSVIIIFNVFFFFFSFCFLFFLFCRLNCVLDNQQHSTAHVL
jgi:tRNA dimethylallyltransferase